MSSNKIQSFNVRSTNSTKNVTTKSNVVSPRDKVNKYDTGKDVNQLSYPKASKFKNYRCTYCLKGITEPQQNLLHKQNFEIKSEMIKYSRESTFFRQSSAKTLLDQKISLSDRMFLANIMREDLWKFFLKLKVKIGDLLNNDFSTTDFNSPVNPNAAVHRKEKVAKVDKLLKESFAKLKIFEEVIIPFNERAKCEKCNRFEKDFDQTEHFPILPNPGYIIVKDYYTKIDKMKKEGGKKKKAQTIEMKKNDKKISYKFMVDEFVLQFIEAITNQYHFRKNVDTDYKKTKYILKIYEEIVSKLKWKNKKFMRHQILVRKMKTQTYFDKGVSVNVGSHKIFTMDDKNMLKIQKLIKEIIEWYGVYQGIVQDVEIFIQKGKNAEKREEQFVAIVVICLYYYIIMLHFYDQVDLAFQISRLLHFLIEGHNYRSVLFHNVRISSVRFKDLYTNVMNEQDCFYRVIDLLIERKAYHYFYIKNDTKALNQIPEMYMENTFKSYDYTEQIARNEALIAEKQRKPVSDMFLQFYGLNKQYTEPYDPHKALYIKQEKKAKKKQLNQLKLENKFNKIMGDDKLASTIYSEHSNYRKSNLSSKMFEKKPISRVLSKTDSMRKMVAETDLKKIKYDKNNPILVQDKIMIGDNSANQTNFSCEDTMQQIRQKKLVLKTENLNIKDAKICNYTKKDFDDNLIESISPNNENSLLQTGEPKTNNVFENSQQTLSTIKTSQNAQEIDNQVKVKTPLEGSTIDGKSDFKTNTKMQTTLDSSRAMNHVMDSAEIKDSNELNNLITKKKIEDQNMQNFLSQPNSVRNQTNFLSDQKQTDFKFKKNDYNNQKFSTSNTQTADNCFTKLSHSKSSTTMNSKTNHIKSRSFQIKKGPSFNISDKHTANFNKRNNCDKQFFIRQENSKDQGPESCINEDFKNIILKVMDQEKNDMTEDKQAVKCFTESCLNSQQMDKDGCIGYIDQKKTTKGLMTYDFPDKDNNKFYSTACNNKVNEYQAIKESMKFGYTLDKEKHAIRHSGDYGQSLGIILHTLKLSEALKKRADFENKLKTMEENMPNRLQSIILKNKDYFNQKKILWNLGVKVVTHAPDEQNNEGLLPDNKTYKVITTDYGQKLASILNMKKSNKNSTKEEKDARLKNELKATKDKGDQFEKIVSDLVNRNRGEKPKKANKKMDPAVYERTKHVITNNLLENIDRNVELEAERNMVYHTVFPKKHEKADIEFDGDTKLIDKFPTLKMSVTDKFFNFRKVSTFTKQGTDLSESKEQSFIPSARKGSSN